ncbi:hypothetical protein ABZ814_22730 [Micromonospora musae]|uniref:hypothetical protein n=1 Tax=Micromonospora musae TaxID=1894970 RepID=UPI0033D74325
MTTNDIDAIRPATDLLIANLRETVGQIQAHEHPERGGDLYCLNLTSYMGDRMGPVLRRLTDEQAETRKWQERNTALADEFTAETERLNAELEQTRAALTASRTQAATLANEVGALTSTNARLLATVDNLENRLADRAEEVAALKAELERMRAVVEAAKYEYGDMWCLDGECDHEISSDDAPCPMVETRYATADEILAVKALLMSTDGDALDDDDEIPVGEIRRVLGEAREAATR